MRTDKDLTESQWKIREAAEADLETFIRLIAPKNVMGAVHQELCEWWTRSEAKHHQLVLLPRDHAKSRYAGFRAAWYITKNPECRIIYISATSNLAEKQLKFIKDILTHPIYTKYWPEMVHQDEGKREKWTNSEIAVDHPKRKEEAIRDPTVFAAGLTTAYTGMHCDVAVLDDVVVYENAYTEEGRSKVESLYSLISSIEGADAQEWVVGTRYHPLDLYGNMLSLEEEIFDDQGNIVGSEPIYEVFERVVEDNGDGTGQFLWPRQQRSDGKWFGFDQQILARKRAKYVDKTQFYAQYYNDPNTGDGTGLDRSYFQYYDPSHLKQKNGHWYFGQDKLNIIAGMDFAYSTGKKSDYTVIVVAGMDSDRNIYVLDIDRFQTNIIKDYYTHLLDSFKKWDFKKLIAETVAAQEAIVKELKNSYLRPSGIMLSIVEEKPNRHDGKKIERIKAALDPVYMNNQVWHYRGGNCQVLEDELILEFPPHDDCKDALAAVVGHLTPPSSAAVNRIQSNVIYHPKFGGVVA
tara:strand:- start:2068 stop:3627 length:1560 start_codon:yes stop_codon:yes gene_type:complete